MDRRLWNHLKRLSIAGFAGLLLAGGSPVQAEEMNLIKLKEQVERQQRELEYLYEVVEETRARQEQQGIATADPGTVREMGKTYLAEEKASEEVVVESNVKEYEVGKDLDFKAKWKNGIYFETADKAFTAHLRGRFDNDYGFNADDANVTTAPGGIGNIEDGTFFRRARIGVEGTIWEVFKYVAEFDFGNGEDITFADVYTSVNQLPWVGSFRAGHFKEPFSLEQLTSARYITFIERSIVDTFAPARNTGFMFSNSWGDETGIWALGLFRPTDSAGARTDGEGDGEWAVTSRVTFLPWYENDGRCLIHIGGAGMIRDMDDGDGRFRARPYRIPPTRNFLDTGVFQADSEHRYGAEFAAVLGSLSVQAEYMIADVDNASVMGVPLGDPTFQGYYFFVSYFLTGEHRDYKRSSGAFDRVIPHENFWLVRTGGDCWGGICSGIGAWEIAARYAWLDLNDSGILGGEMDQYTVGLNWYWNPNMKVMWNYELLDLNPAGAANDGQISTFVMRFHVDW